MSPTPSPVLSSRGRMLLRLGMSWTWSSLRFVSPLSALMSVTERLLRRRYVRPVSPLNGPRSVIELLLMPRQTASRAPDRSRACDQEPCRLREDCVEPEPARAAAG